MCSLFCALGQQCLDGICICGPGDWTFNQQQTTLNTTAGMLLKLNRVGPGQFLDGRPDAAGSGVGGPVGGTLSSGLKKCPNAQGSGWGHCPV